MAQRSLMRANVQRKGWDVALLGMLSRGKGSRKKMTVNIATVEDEGAKSSRKAVLTSSGHLDPAR